MPEQVVSDFLPRPILWRYTTHALLDYDNAARKKTKWFTSLNSFPVHLNRVVETVSCTGKLSVS